MNEQHTKKHGYCNSFISFYYVSDLGNSGSKWLNKNLIPFQFLEFMSSFCSHVSDYLKAQLLYLPVPEIGYTGTLLNFLCTIYTLGRWGYWIHDILKSILNNAQKLWNFPAKMSGRLWLKFKPIQRWSDLSISQNWLSWAGIALLWPYIWETSKGIILSPHQKVILKTKYILLISRQKKFSLGLV